MASPARLSAPVVLGAYAVGASFVPVFQRYLTFHFDQFTQNFYRFLTGSSCLVLLSGLLWPRELLRLLRSRKGMAGVAVPETRMRKKKTDRKQGEVRRGMILLIHQRFRQ